MHRGALSLLTILLLATACAGPPRTAKSRPWYETESNLELKAAAHREHTQSLLNRQGLLLYRAALPWDDSEDGVRNYHDSHDIADAPAWHGLEMASLAFEWAVTGESRDSEISRMADGLLRAYEITGTRGVLVRSYLADYTGARLDWMETPRERPFNYWTQGEQGHWYRKGLAKNHLNLAVFGCAMPLYLDREGDIHLSDETRSRLVEVVVPAVRRLIEGGFRIRCADGTFTRYGDLRPDVGIPGGPIIDGLANGFNRVLVLHMLASASPYDPEVKRVYERKAFEWAPGIGESMETLGEIVSFIGRRNIEAPTDSDMSAYGLASFSLILQEERRSIVRSVRRGMTGLWEYMRYEVNPLFTLPYCLVRDQPNKVEQIVTTLRRFPMPQDKKVVRFKFKDSGRIQPITNRPPSSNYWKSSPYRRVNAAHAPIPQLNPRTGAEQFYSSQDYNLAYWLGRFVGVMPVE